MKTVLVIDDDSALLKAMQGALRSRNFETLVAENGARGLELARTRTPDLIISDIQMELGDGYSVLQSLRNDPAMGTIPFILITGQAGISGMRRGMELGADDYLTKPFTNEQLFAAVEARLARQTAVLERAETRLADLRMKLSLMLPHELNTPLTGILAFGEILQQRATALKPTDLAEIGKRLGEAGQRLQRLIQNFLLYSETELLLKSPAETPDCPTGRSFAVRTTIANTAQELAQRHHRPSDLQLELPETASSVLSLELTAKVMDELLDNAFKFSAPGTPVRVRCVATDEVLEISISDAGRGMTVQEIAAIGPYVQFNRQRYVQRGAGLGLIVAKRIVELHRGTIAIQSEPGKGTHATVRLPHQQTP